MDVRDSKEFIISEFKSGKTVKQIAIFFKDKEAKKEIEKIIFEYMKSA